MLTTFYNFHHQLKRFMRERPQHRHNIGDVPVDADYRIFKHKCGGVSGYAITHDGELRCVFSTKRGYGKRLIRDAVWRGAKHLDCFDGYLVDLYKQAGFVEVRREPNWTEGQPDVVFMALAKSESEAA